MSQPGHYRVSSRADDSTRAVHPAAKLLSNVLYDSAGGLMSQLGGSKSEAWLLGHLVGESSGR